MLEFQRLPVFSNITGLFGGGRSHRGTGTKASRKPVFSVPVPFFFLAAIYVLDAYLQGDLT